MQQYAPSWVLLSKLCCLTMLYVGEFFYSHHHHFVSIESDVSTPVTLFLGAKHYIY